MSMDLTNSQENLHEGYSFDCFNVARTPREKRTFIFIAAGVGSVILGLIIGIVVLAIHSGRSNQVAGLNTLCNVTECSVTAATCKADKPNTQCTSAECNLQAAGLLYNLDPSVNPCDDFFKYSCGRWLKDSVVYAPFAQNSPFMEQQFKVTTQIRELLNDNSSHSDPTLGKAAIMYNACMNPDNSALRNVLLNVIQDVGGWPLAEIIQPSIKTLDDIIPILVKIRKYTGIGGIFTMLVQPGSANASHNVITLRQPPMPVFHNDVPKEEDFDFFIKLLKEINIRPSGNFESDIRELFKVNSFIKKRIVPVDPTNIKSTSLTIDDLTKKTNIVNWLQYFNDVFAVTQKTFKGNDLIEISELTYFIELSDYLGKFTPTLGRAIVNYEVLNLLRFIKLVDDQLVVKINKPPFQQLTNSIPKLISPEKWYICAEAASDWFAYAIAPEYGKRYISTTAAVSAAKEMTQYITEAFKERLNNLNWLSDAQHEALRKIDLMKQNYNYPKWAEDKTKVNNFYDSFAIGASHYENCVEYIKFITRTNYQSINNADGPNIMLPSPLTVNAFYYPQGNSINILQAIMQPPIFGADRLKVMNFGALGMILAHEITHGFDTTGRHYDSEGNLVDWMGAAVTSEFNKKANCFINQYSKYKLTADDFSGYDGSPIPVDGNKTVAENIADNGGIRNAYMAYKAWEKIHDPEVLPPALDGQFTHDKIFFISFAHAWCTKYSYAAQNKDLFAQDTHSPAKFRILGSLSNFEEFSKAFNCPVGAAMNPTDRCILW